MTGELQIVLLIVSSILGYLARMKIKSKCMCCECQIERDSDNKVQRLSVVKKTRSQRDLSVDTISEIDFESKKSEKPKSGRL